MKTICAFDFETHLIERGNITPKPVVLTTYVLGPDGERVDDPHAPSAMTDYGEMRAFFAEALAGRWDYVAAHNLPFDAFVAAVWLDIDLGATMARISEGRWIDTRIREQLAGIAYGWSNERFASVDPRTRKPFKTSLAAAVLAHFNEDIEGTKSGGDAWRLRYAELDGVPLDEWPDAALKYALDDPYWTAKVARAQVGMPGTPAGQLHGSDDPWLFVNEAEQTSAAMALHWCAMNGPRTEAAAVERFRAYHEQEAEKGIAEGVRLGFLRWNKRRFKTGRVDGKGKAVYEPGWSEDRSVLQPLAASCYPRGVPYDALTDSGKYWAAQAGFGQDDLVTVSDWSEKVTYTNADGKERSAKVYSFVSISESSLAALEHRGGVGKALATYGSVATSRKMINQYVPILEAGTRASLTSSPWPLVNTGRSSWRNPNMQNPPRKGGFRECFKARPGNLYVSIDYSAIELVCLAQIHMVLFGESALADMINAGIDPHSNFAAQLLGISYDTMLARLTAGDAVAKAARQAAKAANFGFPGGMGPARTVETYGHEAMCAIARPDEVVEDDPIATAINVARRLKADWLLAVPQERRRQMWVGAQTTDGSTYTYKHPYSGRIRGGLSYCDGCNTPFQGLAADGAKAALVEIARRSMAGEGAWAGVAPWLFVHDEIILEGPADTVTEWADEAAQIMVDAMRRFTPDVRVAAEPAAMRRWYKDADTLRLADGTLVPWEPWKRDGDVWRLRQPNGDEYEIPVDEVGETMHPEIRAIVEALILDDTANGS